MLSEIPPNGHVGANVVVKSVKVKSGGKGPALSGYVGDRSGSVRFVMWQATKEDTQLFMNEEAVNVSGSMGVYEGKPQVTVELVSEAKEPDWSALLERAPRAINEMFNDLTALVPRIAASDPDLAEVVTVTINADAFKMSPAASGMHHAYIGGLLEHTLGVAQAAIAMTPPGMDNAYILAGAILHDVGKCEEYTMTGKIRPAGKLIGHAALGVSSFLSLASGFKIPEADKQRVAHLIAAHHGRREWGAIVEPQTVEAWVVHFADMLDARLFTERKEAEARS